MFCPNCGADIPDDSRFCPKCGAEVDVEAAGRQKANESDRRNGTPEPGSTGRQTSQSALDDRGNGSDPGNGRKPTPKVIGIIIAAVVVIAVIVVLIVVLSNNCGGGEGESSAVEPDAVVLDDYVDISAEGYNGYGTVSYTFDTASFVNDCAEKAAYKSADGKGEPSASAAKSLADRVADTGIFSKSEDLFNGDEITFSWDFNPEEIENLYDVNLKHDDITYTVEGLEELEEVDVMDGGELNGNAFEGITVKFSGTSPQGTASVDTANSIDGVTPSMFTLSKSSWLANGDTVTVSITDEGKEQLAERCGIAPTETEKEFTVEGLAFYPSDISEIPEDSFKTAWTRIEENYTEEVKPELDESYGTWGHQLRKFVSMNYDGCYFFVDEETGSNVLLFVYDIYAYRCTNTDEGNELSVPVNYYWFAYYKDVIVDEDGKWVVPSAYNDLTTMLGDSEPTFVLESEYYFLGMQHNDFTYTGFLYLDEMTQEIKKALPEYTLVNDTVSGNEDEGTAPEENNETEEQTPEENNEAEQQESD